MDEIPKSVEQNHIELEAITTSIPVINDIVKNEHIQITNIVTSVPQT